MSSEHTTRRDFLAAAGVLAASALTADAAASQPAPTPQPQPEEAPAAGGKITSTTIAEASKLAAIDFTETEREMMAKSIGRQISTLKGRQAHGFLPNDLAPAMVFDPRTPGFRVRHSRPSLFRSDPSTVAPAPPADDTEIAFSSVSHLSRWIEAKQITSTRLTTIYLERLKRLDPKLRAVVTLTEDLALKQAQQADAEIAAGKYRGPLHGIPWGAKDLFDTAGIKTTWGAEPFKDRTPATDAAVVEKLAEAGAVLVAKLALGALAYGDIWFGGRTNNPWDLSRGSSGSSAGSAAATAAGMVGFALGTETLGSIVSPCSACGATGLRPTFGRVSRRGAMSLCWSLDKIGPICRTAEDCGLVLAAINGGDPADASSIDTPVYFDANQPLVNPRVGYDRAWFERRGAGETEKAVLAACAKANLTLVPVEIPKWPYDTLMTILNCEAAAAFEELTRTNQDDQLSWQAPQAWPNTFRQTWFIPGVELVQAERFRRQVMTMMAEKFEGLDAFIGGHTAGSMLLITNNTGHPSLTIRAGFRENGLPTSITLNGRLFDEGTLCRIGMALETQFGVWDKQPSLS